METDKPFACDICGKSFVRKDSIITHRRVHTGEKPYACKVCQNTYKHRSGLAQHMKNIHIGGKPYECSICKKTFSENGSLVKHMWIHYTVENPYGCDICEKKFSDNRSLANHQRIHMSGDLANYTGENPYECDICKKTFSKSCHLAEHIRIHTGEKPYSCELCQKSFTQKSQRSQHYKTSAHMNRILITNTNTPSSENTFVDCGEIIKVEDIKEEIIEDETTSVKGDINPLEIKSKKCDTCQKCFPEQFLSAHQRLHSEDKFHLCELCGLVFKTKDYLARHNNGDIMYGVCKKTK